MLEHPMDMPVKIESGKFLGSVVIPHSLSGLSAFQIRGAIYAGVVSIISQTKPVTLSEDNIRVRGEIGSLIGQAVDRPTVGTNCSLYITESHIRTNLTDEDETLLFNHKFTCISFTGTSIPYRDNIFVYVAQLNHNNREDYEDESESRQLFIFEFTNPFTAERIFKTLNAVKATPFRKHVEKYPLDLIS